MCSPWTITSPVRWRIRDWTYMLCPCRFPLEEEEEEEGACSSVPEASSEAMFMDTTGRYSSSSNRQVMHSPKQSGDSRDNDDDDSSWPRFAEEDYIVFCFGEDGTFDVVKDGRGGASDHPNCINRESRTSTKPVNRKLNYGENEDQDYSRGGRKDDDPSTYEGDSIISDEEGEEEGSIYLDASSPPDEIIKGGDEIEESIIESSSSSNQSNDSVGSFAFPVLRFEGIGSPVQMPRSEDLQLRKHKGRGLSFRCCRF